MPRIADVLPLLDSLQPIHGLLLTEGEDIGGDYLPNQPTEKELDASASHASETIPDHEKDSIEFQLVRRCLRERIPVLGICRGSQLVNVACGGTLHTDVVSVLNSNIKHIDYDNYDTYRHALHLVPNTPVHGWFDKKSVIDVNSYHHQGVAQLAERFCPMAFAPDGLVEAYYDANWYNISAGQFVVGLQFHPERMQDVCAALEGRQAQFDYAGCCRPYRDFVAAASAFQQLRHHSLLRSTLQNTINKTKSVKDSLAGKRQFSRDEWSRLLKFGATVHGACLVQSILQGQNDGIDVDGGVVMRKKRSSMIQKLVDKLHQAERALYGLHSDKKLKEADDLLEQLSSLGQTECASPGRENLTYRFAVSPQVSL